MKKIKRFFFSLPNKVNGFAKKHKIISFLILLLVFVGAYFSFQFFNRAEQETSYVFAQAEIGTIMNVVSGSGQVASVNQLDLKAKTSGEIVYSSVKSGQEVKIGQVLMNLDDSEAKKAVRDAEISLETAMLELERMLEPIDELTLLQAENSLRQTKEAKQKTEDNLVRSYEDGFNAVSNVFLELPEIMSGLYDILYSFSLRNGSQQNIDYYTDSISGFDLEAFYYRDLLKSDYQKAREMYEENFKNFKSLNRFSEPQKIENLISQTYETTKNISQAVKSAFNFIQFYRDKLIERNLSPHNLSQNHLSFLSSYTGKTNNFISSLSSANRNIQDYKDSILNYERTIEEKTLSLQKTNSGPDDFEIRSKKITIEQRKEALLNAKQLLADCSIKAPFSGIIAKINYNKGDYVSSGSVLATIISSAKMAEISLNEIDAAKIKEGQKATLAFDAINDLSIAGEVFAVDVLGSVSQGVVSYAVKIIFLTADERIKPGMSVFANIATEIKQDVLTVPVSAVKFANNVYYVEKIASQQLTRQNVKVGISDDNKTEIILGLSVGEEIVARAIVSSANPSTDRQSQQAQTLFQIPGMGGGGALQQRIR